MEIKEINIDDIIYMNEIVEMEKSTFGRFGGVDLWILKPMVKFGKVFVALKDEKVIGAAEFMIAFDRNDAFLYGFSVMEKFQRHGVGRNLLSYCEQYFKERGVKTMSLTVDPKNKRAITLYQHMNYIIESLEINEYEEGVDRYRMKKFL